LTVGFVSNEQHIDNLVNLMTKRIICEKDANEARRVLYGIHLMEKKGELAHIIPSTGRSRPSKKLV
jgi:hypothetical protein